MCVCVCVCVCVSVCVSVCLCVCVSVCVCVFVGVLALWHVLILCGCRIRARMLVGHAPSRDTLDPHAQCMVVHLIKALQDETKDTSVALCLTLRDLPASAIGLCCAFLGTAAHSFTSSAVKTCAARVLRWPLTEKLGTFLPRTTRSCTRMTHSCRVVARTSRPLGVWHCELLVRRQEVLRHRHGRALFAARRCVSVHACLRACPVRRVTTHRRQW